jgi:alpha,alpha-trehalase
MADPHLAGLEMSIKAENWAGYIDIRSGIDGNVKNTGVVRYRQLNNAHLMLIESQSMNDIVCLQVATNQSHIEVAEAARTQVYLKDETLNVPRKVIQDRSYIAHEFTINIQQGEITNIEKVVALFTSKDYAISDCSTEALKKVRRTANFATLLESHTLAWDNLWRRCDIAIENSKQSALALHLHIFHMLQTLSLNTVDLDAGIPARGLHGEAYRGHVFWDELFIFPFFNLRLPGITFELLLYRYRRLSEARWAAKQAGYEGAMYPWQSGSDGREESQTIHLNPRSGRWVSDSSHLQRHINAAIAYNVWDYYQVSGDIDFLSSYGAEMIVEIARFWASITNYNPSLDRYEIHKVMGPDEYHDSYPDAAEPGLDNNAYTNLMAVWVLWRALDVLELLPTDSCNALWNKLHLQQQELEKWDDISRKMRILFHENGIISQFEGYDQLKEFDWEGYRLKYGNIQRLDRILEAEGDTTNRYKVSKQADVLMLFYLLSADELRELFERLGYTFEYETISNNIDYYLQRTSHGSTLSRVVHSWVLARSQRELSWHLFTEALKTDISDIQGGTTSEGIHLGAMAGTVDLIQRCYTGLETREDTLWFNPCLPDDLKEVRFDIHYRGHWINLRITSDRLRFHTRPYDIAPLKVGFQDTIYELKPGDTVEIPIVCTTG